MKQSSRKPGPGRTKKNSAKPEPQIRNRRRWLFRFAALSAPLICFILLEAGLRLAGYGYDTGFFKRIVVGQEKYLVENEAFSLRFFPPALARTPEPILLRVQKPADTCRIFILGESAAMGDPEPAFGASRYLEALLRERFPARKFEVVNVAVTAINSHVVRAIARDCARQPADFWIVYLGNNEMVGPYGAATIFGAQAPPCWLVRMLLALQRTRVGQALMSLGQHLKTSAANPPAWTGMQMFQQNRVPPDDRRRATVYKNFQSNLDDILQAGTGAGAAIILNTVAVNLRDCPPFASHTNSAGRTEARTDVEHLLAEATRLTEAGNSAEAADQLSHAAKLDELSAEVEFRWADCLSRLRNGAAAREHFQRACDLDALPFRADDSINTAIRQAGNDFARQGVQLFDAADFFATNAPAGSPGREIFYEHVHFNFDGNYRLARAWAGVIEPQLPATAKQNAATNWATQELCERRLGLTVWNRAKVIEGVADRLRQPPLSTQSNNARRLAALETWDRELHLHMDAGNATLAAAVYQDAIQRQPDDYYLHINFADFLTMAGDFRQASVEWQRVRELRPHFALAQFKLGALLARQNRLAEAETELRAARERLPYLGEVYLELGRALALQGKFEPALAEYQQALRLRPNSAECFYEIGKALVAVNRRDEAIQNLREAIRRQPDHWQAHFGLGAQLAQENQFTEARAEFEQVIRIKPDYAPAHLNLGVALMKAGKFAEAGRAFEEAVRLEPGNPRAMNYLNQARAAQPAK